MGIPVPLSRAQQIVGFPEHPCEAIIKNGAIYTPYEEMEVRFFPEHLGAVVALYIGDGKNRELFGKGKYRASASLKKGYLPDVTHETEQLGCRIRQTVFGTLIDGDRVKDGTEPLICMISVEVTNLTEEIINLTLNVKFGTCFVPQVNEDDYWHNFLKRDDVWSDFDADNELQPYPVPIAERGGMLYAEGLGLLFVPERCCGGNPSVCTDGAIDGWNFEMSPDPGKTKRITCRLPYYPIDARYAASVASLDYDSKCAETDAVWEDILTRGMQLDIPGISIGNLFRAQTAMTFLLIDRQNKGSSSLYGCEMYNSWADRYPDKVLCYPHLSPSLYEFIWAQEAAFWVLGALDMQGYHRETEEYLEVFFALQGEGTPGVYDKSVLPDKAAAASYMGTTPHSWLNSTGGVLSAIARHYLLTRNDVWFDEHKDSVLSACRWISALRAAAKKQESGSGYGIMPRGQSTDCTFASDHLQWYYTDIGTIRGLKDITGAAEMRGWKEAVSLRGEYEDYRICLLRSVDSATRDLCDFKKDIRQYDFTPYKYASALPSSLICDFDENGIPVLYKNNIMTREDAESAGIGAFVPMSPQANIPFKEPYLDNGSAHAFGLIADIIDFQSDEPLYRGARHTGREIWSAIEKYEVWRGSYDPGKKEYLHGNTYNYYLLNKMLACGEEDAAGDIIRFTARYALDPDTFVMNESCGDYTASWFIPCPFTLSMASFRMWIRMALLYEDSRGSSLVIGKAVLTEWLEATAARERPIEVKNASTQYGPVSFTYGMTFRCASLLVTVHFHEKDRLPDSVAVRCIHPQKLNIRAVKLNGAGYEQWDAGDSCVRFNPRLSGTETRLEIFY